MKKMNMVEKFGAIKAMLNGEKPEGFSVADALEFLDDRIEKVNAKNAKGADRKPTATQVANEGIKAEIVEFLRSVGKPVTNGEIAKGIGSDQPNKVCQLVAQMLTVRKGVENPDGCIVRTEVKGRAYFALADKTEE